MTQNAASSAANRRHAPAALRNREPIRTVLSQVLPQAGRVMEIGAGTGEHAVHFAAAFPQIIWQPTDPDPTAVASIAAWSADVRLPNLLPPLSLDVRSHPWPSEAGTAVDAVVSINMIHIAPWEACEGLMAGAAEVLRPGGVLFLYGPFKQDGQHTAPSNAAFDASLKRLDPRFGVRDLDTVAAQAATGGLTFERAVPMPANNLSVVFRKLGGLTAGSCGDGATI
ncbi:MAG: DUF938 domain-containing protein [Defluviicoccus sp.]|nr:MAG: DUF938 domain-containing protein [Defluviicoccus sp.]